MKVGLEKNFPMPGTADQVWQFLQNIEGVAGCMPGAKITERLDDTHFKGTVAVKVGPASMSFRGDIEVRELDASNRLLRLIGRGSDSSGTSGATMDLTARVQPGATPETSVLVGKSEVAMSGKAAAFGGRMMGTVADQILNQFAVNFANQVQALAAASLAAGAVSGNTLDAQTSPETAATTPAPTATAAHKVASEINALALLWAIIRDWFRGIFRRRPA